MAYSDELKVFWFNPMRSATRSTGEIQQFLKFNDVKTHFLPTEEQKKYYLISNIRNPYPRLVSIFHFVFSREVRGIPDFHRFITKKILEEKNNIFGTKNYQINLSKIYEEIGRVPDKLIKVENLYEDIKSLWFCKSPDLDKIMKENIKVNNYFQEYGARPSWKEHYNDEIAETVYDYLKNDFDLGNYDKNSWKDGTP